MIALPSGFRTRKRVVGFGKSVGELNQTVGLLDIGGCLAIKELTHKGVFWT